MSVQRCPEGCQTISGNFYYGIPKRRAFIFSFAKAGARFSSAPAPCADRHARQPAPFFSIQNAAQLYHGGLSVYRPRLGDYTFEEIVTQVHHYMRYYINSKFLRGDITTMPPHSVIL